MGAVFVMVVIVAAGIINVDIMFRSVLFISFSNLLTFFCLNRGPIAIDINKGQGIIPIQRLVCSIVFQQKPLRN